MIVDVDACISASNADHVQSVSGRNACKSGSDKNLTMQQSLYHAAVMVPALHFGHLSHLCESKCHPCRNQWKCMTEVFLAFCPQNQAPTRARACGPDVLSCKLILQNIPVLPTHLQPMLSGLTSLGSRASVRYMYECSPIHLFMCRQHRLSQQLPVGTRNS